MSLSKVAPSLVVKGLSSNIFGVTGTDAMDTYLTGGVGRPAASTARTTTAAPTTPPPPQPHK